MKTPFNITIPADLPIWRKVARLVWRVILRLTCFAIIPFVTLIDALVYARKEDSIRLFAENFWRAFSRATWTSWHLTAGYYRAYHPTGGCGPYTWFVEKPQDPQDGSIEKWRWTRGY